MENQIFKVGLLKSFSISLVTAHYVEENNFTEACSMLLEVTGNAVHVSTSACTCERVICDY